MTLLFAALLGNFLAWCVHAFTWWLREKFLDAIANIGGCFTICALLFLLVWTIFDLFNLLVGENSGALFSILIITCIFATTCFILGWLHKRFFVTDEVEPKIISSLAFSAVAESGLACLVAFTVSDMIFGKSGQVMLWAFFSTLLILAFIRPQVVKVQKWLWQQVKLQRATNE